MNRRDSFEKGYELGRRMLRLQDQLKHVYIREQTETDIAKLSKELEYYRSMFGDKTEYEEQNQLPKAKALGL